METQPTKIDSLILDEKWNYHMTVSHLTIVKYVNRLTPHIVMTHMDIVINDLDAVKEYQIEQIKYRKFSNPLILFFKIL